MLIEKVLNNNVVVVKSEKNLEQIVMGRGIAFQKRAGDYLDEDKIDKVFILSDPEIANKFQELIVNIPIEHIQMGEEIVSYVKLQLGRKLSDMIYISLVDHIFTALERAKQGLNIKNILLWDIKRFYKTEYRIGLEALDLIEARTQTRLSDDEAGFIALHIVNAELDDKRIQDIYEITKIMQEITNIVKYEFNFTFDEESVYYYRFVTHLKFFAQRLITDNTYRGNQDDDLLDVVMRKYHNSFACVEKISDFIGLKYDYRLSNEEKVYLTIHIERVIYKSA